MDRTVNVAEAKATLSELLDAAMAGEKITIARKGKPIARLEIVEELKPRVPGAAKHWKIRSDAFLRPLSKKDRAWLEGEHTDEFGISKPTPKPTRKRRR
jgi:prevent-host-death family protein